MMAIEKNNVKTVSRIDSEYSVGSRSRESMSTEDDEFRRRNSMESEDDDEFDDADSGAGSDDFDLLELGETGSEFCQVGDQTCCIPFELYGLQDLQGILSLDVWNECLTEEERFGLTKYLPDMDQDTFMLTLKELFEGGNFHFSSPITELYQMLKGGQCEPRVALYRQGMNFFQTHQHYHLLRRHQDSMVSCFLQMKEAWKNCKGYSIEEKLRVLNLVKSQKSLMRERNWDMGSDPSERESDEALMTMRLKGRGAGKKAGHDHLYGAGPALDVFSGGRAGSVDVTNYGQQNPKGLLKVGGSKNPSLNVVSASVHPRVYGNQGMNTGARGSEFVSSRGGKAVMHDFIKANGDDQEVMHGMTSKGHWNAMDGNVMARGRHVKPAKKREVFVDDECNFESYLHPRQSLNAEFSAHGRNLNINQLSDIKVLTSKPSNVRGLYDPSRRPKYADPGYDDQMRPAKGRVSQNALKVAESYWIKNAQGETYLTNPAFDYDHRNVEIRKLKLGSEYPDHRLKSIQPSQQMEDRFFRPSKRAKLLPENIGEASMRNGGSNMYPLKGDAVFHEGEETESDSSDQIEDEEHINSLIMSKRAMHGHFENSRSSVPRSVLDEKKMKRVKKGFKEGMIPDRVPPDFSTMANYGNHMARLELETHPSKIRQKSKTNNLDSLQNFSARVSEDCFFDGIRNPYIEGDRRSSYKLGRNGQVPAELAGGSPMSFSKASSMERRQKGNVGNDFSLIQSNNARDYNMEEDGGSFEGNHMERNVDPTLVSCNLSVKKKKKKRKEVSTEIDGLDGSVHSPSHQHLSELIPSKSLVKKRPEAESGSPGVSTSEVPVLEVGMADAEREVKPQKKTLPPITPTVHTGFSFSIIHLLSAVRMALVTPSPDDALGNEKPLENTSVELKDQNVKHEEALDMNNQCPEKSNRPLTVQEIVNRVRSDPGDPCILETQEPLLDLIRGVLKIFSSKTAPLGAKGWKPLICYEKSTKCWSWAGPAPQSSTDLETPEEVISPDAWKISRKMLVKLVDAYANWLKSGQETLQQIGSLPPPPAELMQLNFDEKERFRDLRAQKSLITITQSSDEVKDYFRKEEHLRYSVPDRAFSYTAADGKKSIVAPLRRCGGKPTSKARDHFMLKRDRPPHVTILCLVRDAAARLPGSIGTRADVCTLIRDSQYIVEEVTDSQVNQVVSGALDRLHYERDPCVQFDSERKLWVYLHRDREEEDFEDDGTSSTKKWKRQKKDASEQDDQVTVACHASTEPNGGLDVSSDLNVALTCLNSEKTSDVLYDDARQGTEDDERVGHSVEEIPFQQILEDNLQCQDQSTNEGLDGRT